ncbi:META domain-containing protein [Mucilaginibacter sp. X5P1]|uniref:META domain-containing protein n=1 Tax=Mucilaginibacter sp. X5P1 TaxID=2723088 RepID=UPI0017C36398|nr:heat shock protein HslJ [Mucilaginibacter sp. X5P1]
MMKLKLSLMACLLVVLSACSTIKKDEHSAVDARINNIVWTVVSFKGKVLNERDYGNGLPSITFEMQDNKINGSDGCNTFMGVAAYKGNDITAGPIATTQMACPGNTISADFYEALASKHLTWALTGDGTLRLLVNDAEVMALKERQ